MKARTKGINNETTNERKMETEKDKEQDTKKTGMKQPKK